jgi:hypothetical protein
MNRIDPLFEIVRSKVFHKRVRDLPSEVLTNVQTDLVQNAERRAVVQRDARCSKSSRRRSGLGA